MHIGFPVFLIGSGYMTAVASAVYGISNGDVEEVSYWVYYESLFYISAMMHLPLALKLCFSHTRRVPSCHDALTKLDFRMPSSKPIQEPTESLHECLLSWRRHGLTCHELRRTRRLACGSHLPRHRVHPAVEDGARPEMVSAQERGGPQDGGEGAESALVGKSSVTGAYYILCIILCHFVSYFFTSLYR